MAPMKSRAFSGRYLEEMKVKPQADAISTRAPFMCLEKVKFGLQAVMTFIDG